MCWLKNILFAALLTIAGPGLFAQYCGGSGGFHCSVLDSSADAGYYPPSENIPPFINNLLSSVSLQFKNYDSIFFGSEVLYVYSATIDSINNLPYGLCWTSDQDSNTYKPGQIGCVKIGGIPCDYTGQYKTQTIVTLRISGGASVETEADNGGNAEYFLRLNNPGDTMIPVDSTQTDSNSFLFYGGICIPLDTLEITMDTNQTLCAGSFVYLNPVVTGGEPPYTYQWQSTGSPLSCDTCASASAYLTRTSTFTLSVTDVDGNVASGSVTYTAAGSLYNFHIYVQGPLIFCDTGSVPMVSYPNVSASYQWYLNNNPIAGATDSIYTASNVSGTYFLQFSLAGCTATSNLIQATFSAATRAGFNTLGSTRVCPGASAILVADSGAGLSYQWLYNGAVQNTRPVDTVTQAGSYQLVVTNSLQCTDTSTAINITTGSDTPPQVSFNYYTFNSLDTFCNNTSPFSLIGGYPPGGNYNGSGVAGNIFYPDSAAAGNNLVTYFYTDSNNCSASAGDTLVVEICTGIQQTPYEAESLTVYPNPSTSQINIRAPFELVNYSLIIYDLTGRRLNITSAQVTGTGEMSLDISWLESGIYHLVLQSSGKIAGASFVKAE